MSYFTFITSNNVAASIARLRSYLLKISPTIRVRREERLAYVYVSQVLSQTEAFLFVLGFRLIPRLHAVSSASNTHDLALSASI